MSYLILCTEDDIELLFRDNGLGKYRGDLNILVNLSTLFIIFFLNGPTVQV